MTCTCLTESSIGCQQHTSATVAYIQWLKSFCEAGEGSPDEARLEQTPYPFQPHILALFRRKITLYRFNQGGVPTVQGAQMGAGGWAPHFNHCSGWNERVYHYSACCEIVINQYVCCMSTVCLIVRSTERTDRLSLYTCLCVCLDLLYQSESRADWPVSSTSACWALALLASFMSSSLRST